MPQVERRARARGAASRAKSKEHQVSTVIIFTLGYFLGGITALVILGLAVAARSGDQLRSPRRPTRDESARTYTDRQ